MSVEGSQGSTGRYRPTNSNDPGWDSGQPVDGNKDHVKCDFCGHVSKGGIKRLKQHLVKASYKGTMYKDVRKCDKVPQDVVDVLRSFMEGKQKITEEKQSKKDEMIRNVNVYGNDDDEVEEVVIQIPKKRKGPMDAFVAPIDVDFRPRAPNSNENKKAFENIHGYIADFFYENSISFNCARSDSYSKMMQAIVQYNDPSTFKPPSYNDLRVKILKKKEETSNWVDNFKVYWETYGVTIMTDWWTDGKGRTLINFLVNCPKGTVFLKSIDGSAHIHDAELIYKMLKDVIEEVGEKNVIQRQELRDMFHTVEWRNSKWPKHPIGKKIIKKVKSNTFWNNMHTCLKIMAPLVDVIRMVDTEEKPSMAYIYSAIEDCKLKVKTNLGDQNDDDRELWKKMERILDRRWSGMLQKPLHAAAHYLNPQYYYATLTSSDEMESNTKLKNGLLDCIAKLALDKEDESQILRDLIVYRTKAGRLGKRGAQACVKTIAPVEWWITFGSEVPALQRFAKRVLGLTSAASPCERIWSTFDNIYTKKRNCLEHDRMRDLAYIQYNRRLKKCYEERISGKAIDPIVLKSFDECAEWLVPDDARDDIVLGTDMTYGVLEDAEDGFDDPPLTRTSHTNTASHCSQEVTSSSRSTTRHLQDSSDDDDYDVDANYGMGDGDDDGIDSGSDEDI
ncbi:hypothetical protein GIB67_027472 [Kingdonia uniflora]|uniref:BED-type domain-containing protein n=1 Tax=Kingdonia uniflora TaxID=39325 RepID=A0A7J7MFC3_9MAGN|nr:hypothetical protein GIB67_027472 [Kingdonia uniflora]